MGMLVGANPTIRKHEKKQVQESDIVLRSVRVRVDSIKEIVYVRQHRTVHQQRTGRSL